MARPLDFSFKMVVMTNSFLQRIKLMFFILEILTINITLFHYRLLLSNQLPIKGVEYIFLTGAINLAWWLAIYYSKLQTNYNVFNFSNFVNRSARLTILYKEILAGSALVLIGAITLQKTAGNFIVVMAGCLLLSRTIYSTLIFLLRKKEFEECNVIFIGYNQVSRDLADQFSSIGSAKCIAGFCDEGNNVRELSRYPVFSGVSSAIDVCTRHNVTEIYSTISPEENKAVKLLLNHANKKCIRFKMVAGIATNVSLNQPFGYNSISDSILSNEPLQYLGNRLIKRGFDIVFSSVVLVFIMSWLLPIIGVLIKLESKGPVLFKQLRSGKNNKPFYCYKFRSMLQNTDADSKQASRNDQRITRIGSFLRRTSLDEFPQFFNVLKGDMSIVGPRPHMIKHTDEYSSLIGVYMLRHFVKPGVTGWAQVNGFRGETQTLRQMEKRIEKDIWYLENWSFGIDVKAILLTVLNAVKGEENAF